jgi:HAD superfamily phosphoserine phosphatase-like hydrolase
MITPLLAAIAAAAPVGEATPGPILDELRRARAALPQGTRAVVVFDFDGTLLKGDITEGGPKTGGRPAFPGMVELGIDSALSASHPPGSFPEWEAVYRRVEQEQGGNAAYVLPLTVFAGAKETSLEELARRHFAQKVKGHLFASTTEVLRRLVAEGFECHVVSASAEAYVAAAAGELGLDRGRFHGVRARLDPTGRITPDIVQYPYREGKATVVRRLLAERPARLVGALGNSWDTDGAMLEMAARGRLDGQGAGAWIFNAGPAPQWAQGLGIREQSLGRTVGEARPADK